MGVAAIRFPHLQATRYVPETDAIMPLTKGIPVAQVIIAEAEKFLNVRHRSWVEKRYIPAPAPIGTARRYHKIGSIVDNTVL